MLDAARDKAGTADDRRSELHWRLAALEQQQRYQEALDLLQNNANAYNSQAYVMHRSARLLVKMGRERDALAVMRDSPYEGEMTSFPVLAMDAKFFTPLFWRRQVIHRPKIF